MADETTPADPFAFDPVPLRARADGWTSQRQRAFIDALAETACVTEACRAVGLSPQSAYALRRNYEAKGFRLAWDAALEYAIRRLSDAVISRALNGVPVPHFYKGEQVGEHRRYDERLAMFLLRYRDPLRYARSLDKVEYVGHDELFALRLERFASELDAPARPYLAEDAALVADLPPPPARQGPEGAAGVANPAWPGSAPPDVP